MAETQTVASRKRIRKFFGKGIEVAEMPNLIEVQRESYDQFLQMKEPAGGRANRGGYGRQYPTASTAWRLWPVRNRRPAGGCMRGIPFGNRCPNGADWASCPSGRSAIQPWRRCSSLMDRVRRRSF